MNYTVGGHLVRVEEGSKGVTLCIPGGSWKRSDFKTNKALQGVFDTPGVTAASNYRVNLPIAFDRDWET